MDDDILLEQHFNKIPTNTQVLITHGPPKYILDQVVSWDRSSHEGSKALLQAVKNIKPKYHLFGHIHSGYGQVVEDTTTYINSAIMDDHYRVAHQAQTFELI